MQSKGSWYFSISAGRISWIAVATEDWLPLSHSLLHISVTVSDYGFRKRVVTKFKSDLGRNYVDPQATPGEGYQIWRSRVALEKKVYRTNFQNKPMRV
jgi:hypothetical protein